MEKGHEKVFLITRFLEALISSIISPPAYKVISYHVKKIKQKELSELLLENPKEAINSIAIVLGGGGEVQTRLLLRILQQHLEDVLNRPIDQTYWRALEGYEVEGFRERLVEVAREYLQRRHPNTAAEM